MAANSEKCRLSPGCNESVPARTNVLAIGTFCALGRHDPLFTMAALLEKKMEAG
jgi:hypothetical protein